MSWPRGRAVDGGLDAVPLPTTSGSVWLCGKRVVAPDPEGALRRAGTATMIVSFNEREELSREYGAYVDWLEANTPGRALWYPIPDLSAPTPEAAVEIIDRLHRRLVAGDRMILHCAGGIGRAPTMAIGVLLAMGMDRGEALAHVAAHRPMAGPEVGAQADLVVELERHYRS